MASNLGQGEHGAGTGLAGGYGTATAANTQAGAYAQQEQQGFNHGLGGEHASGGIPGGHSGSAHPIADKFTGGDKLDNKLDNFTGAAGAGGVGSGVVSGGVGGNPVAGEYAGSGTRDALTGESHATRTGAGVGPLGENTGSGLDSTTGSHGHGLGHGDAKLAPPIPTTYTTGSTQSPVGASAGAGAFAAAAGAGAAGAGAAGLAHGSHGSHGSHGDNANLATASGPVDTSGVDVDSNKYGTGVGASGGAGGHYDETSRSGAGAGALAGAGAGGAAGAGAGAAGASGKEGHFGTAEKGFDRGAPVSDPKSLDTGGPHSLVFQESTGKYVHRHELEGAGSATKH